MLDMYVAFYSTGKECWLLARALDFGLEGLAALGSGRDGGRRARSGEVAG